MSMINPQLHKGHFFHLHYCPFEYFVLCRTLTWCYCSDAGRWKIWGASIKGWIESAPPGWNRVNWSVKYWGTSGPPAPRFRHHCFVYVMCPRRRVCILLLSTCNTHWTFSVLTNFNKRALELRFFEGKHHKRVKFQKKKIVKNSSNFNSCSQWG